MKILSALCLRLSLGLLISLLSLSSFAATGLDWNGTGSVRRMLYWGNPFPMYSATYFFKVYQRQQVTGVGDGSRYYTTFFWGNNGNFTWGSAYSDSYYGAHPYPIPANTGNGKWEISILAGDDVTRDDGSSPYVVTNTWYNQAYLAQNQGGGNHTNRFYIALPSVSSANRITVNINSSSHPSVPPSPAIVVGQAPNLNGASWGGYSRWEEQNAVIRGMQFYNSALTETQILALSAAETDAEVLAECTNLGIAKPWYLNMNPTPTDVQDKSGNGHHPSWEGSGRPTLWSSGPAVAQISLSATPASSSVEELLTRQFTATAYYDDSTNSNVSSSATWSSTNTAVATVNSNGLATGKGAGSAKIIAVYNSFRDTADLTVTASTATLDSLVITGSTGSVVKGGTLTLAALGYYNNSTTQDKTSSVFWNSGNTLVATVSGGTVLGVSQGTVTITASFSGKQDTVIVAVVAQAAFTKKINFQPASTAVPSGYVADDGAAYTAGRGYGWQTAVVESRERMTLSDKRYDTFVKTYAATNWMLDLPSPGSYKITAGMGDPGFATACTLSFGSQPLIAAAASTNSSTVTDTLTVGGSQLVLKVTGAFCFIDVESVGSGSTGAVTAGLSPRNLAGQKGPNPFHSLTTLRYTVNRASRVRIEIYDHAGKMIRLLGDNLREPGSYDATWDGRDPMGKRLASGVYVVRFALDGALFSRKLVLLQ